MKKFKELTIRGQKMRIVRDAIQQIKDQVVIPKTNFYFNISERRDVDINSMSIWEPVPSADLKKLFLKEQVTCTACAKGGLFAACVLNVNKVKTGDYGLSDESKIKTKLAKWFKAGELDTIETAFEKKVIYDTSDILCLGYNKLNTELAKRAIAFGRKYKTPKQRLLSILNNILKNGRFKP